MNTVNRSDILLAIIAAADGKPLEPVHLQKVAFLVAQEFGAELPEDYYEFDKNLYGPFSAIIYSDVDLLDYWGQIKIHWHAQHSKRKYAIVDRHVIESLDIPGHILNYIKETVAWAIKMSFGELVRSIYFEFPEYRENSAFRYSEDDAFVESFRRGMTQYRDGRTQPARQWLDEMRRSQDSNLDADSTVG